jgi:ATP-binding cassette subfamily B protein
MKTLFRLFRYLTPHWRTLVLTALLLILHTGLSLLPPLFQRDIVDKVIVAGDLSGLWFRLAILIVLYLFLHLADFGDLYIRHALGERFIYELRVRIYAHLQRLTLSFFDQTSTGELMSRVTNDVNALENFVTHGVALSTVDMLRLLGSSAVLLALDWRLALVVLVPIPIMAVGLRYFNRYRPLAERSRRSPSSGESAADTTVRR